MAESGNKEGIHHEEFIMKEEIKEILLRKYTERELAGMRYVYTCLLYEGSKFLLLYAIFSLFRMDHEYLAAITVLLSIRNFSGGIHFSTYWGCFLFTFFFLFGAIWASRTIALPFDNRPKLTARQHLFYKSIGCAVTFLYFLLFLCEETFTYRNLIFWVIVFQILQLIAAKIYKKGDHHEKSNTECTRVPL